MKGNNYEKSGYADGRRGLDPTAGSGYGNETSCGDGQTFRERRWIGDLHTPHGSLREDAEDRSGCTKSRVVVYQYFLANCSRAGALDIGRLITNLNLSEWWR